MFFLIICSSWCTDSLDTCHHCLLNTLMILQCVGTKSKSWKEWPEWGLSPAVGLTGDYSAAQPTIVFFQTSILNKISLYFTYISRTSQICLFVRDTNLCTFTVPISVSSMIWYVIFIHLFDPKAHVFSIFCKIIH